MNSGQYWNWRIAVIASIAAPFSVLLPELAHVGALEFGGVAVHLRGFSMGIPMGYFWNFEGQENAKSYCGRADLPWEISRSSRRCSRWKKWLAHYTSTGGVPAPLNPKPRLTQYDPIR